MSEAARIVDQLQRAHGRDSWHGSPVTAILATRDRALGAGVTCCELMHGIAQHDGCHAGQIAILKKLRPGASE